MIQEAFRDNVIKVFLKVDVPALPSAHQAAVRRRNLE